MASSEDKKILLAFLAIVALSVFFRFYNLEVFPKWDFDEGYNMRYSYDLLHGEILWFAIKYTFIPHPPFFFMSYALVLKYLGASVYTMRLFVAFCGVATTVVLYFLGKEMFNPKVGLLASTVYAVTPEVVFWNRLGFANNQLILLSILSMYFIYLYSKTLKEKYLLASSLMAGLCAITEYAGLADVAAIVVFLFVYHRSKTLKFLLLSLLPLAFTLFFMLYYSPEFFLFDINYQYARFFTFKKIGLGLLVLFLMVKGRRMVSNFYRPIANSLSEDSIIYIFLTSLSAFLSTENYFWRATTYMISMCIFGLCMIPSFLIVKEVKERRLIVSFLSFNLLYVLAINRADHLPMALYPFISIAVAAMLYKAYENFFTDPPWVVKRFKLNFPRKLVFALAFYSILVSAGFTAYFFVLGNISKEDVSQVEAVADFINQHASKDDLILTYSWMFPLIKEARVSLLTQSLAYENIPIAYYSGDFPKERFAFNTSYKRAKYLVSDNMTFEWIINETNRTEPVEYMKNWSKNEVAGFIIYKQES